MVSPFLTRQVQFVFCAATMPDNGKKSVRANIRWMFPEVVEVESTGAHRPPPTLKQAFLQAPGVDILAAMSGGDAFLAGTLWGL